MSFLKNIFTSKLVKHETTHGDLLAPVSGLDKGMLLSDWRWLVGKSVEPLVVTALGNVFYRAEEKIFFLDVNDGQFEEVSDNYREFKTNLWGTDQEFQSRFIPGYIQYLRKSGKVLKSGQCYSHKKPICLGGDMHVDNAVTLNAEVHISIMGQIFHQLKDVPPGTKISSINFKVPNA